MTTDSLSRFGHSITNSFIIDLCFSPCLRIILKYDVVGMLLRKESSNVCVVSSLPLLKKKI